MNYKNKLHNLYLRPIYKIIINNNLNIYYNYFLPSNDFSGLPLFNISASLSIKSTISLVKLESNSFTVHLVFNNMSNLSSTLIFLSFKPL